VAGPPAVMYTHQFPIRSTAYDSGKSSVRRSEPCQWFTSGAIRLLYTRCYAGSVFQDESDGTRPCGASHPYSQADIPGVNNSPRHSTAHVIHCQAWSYARIQTWVGGGCFMLYLNFHQLDKANLCPDPTYDRSSERHAEKKDTGTG
jgi:hypothetical protein